MITAILSGALGAVGSIYGAVQSAKANREARERLGRLSKENEDWFNREYNTDATQRADAQRAINMVNDAMMKRNRAASGAAAVSGATDESVAQAKAQSAQAVADTASQIDAAAEARKDAVQEQYRETKAGLEQQQVQLDKEKAANISAATGALGEAAASIIGQIPANPVAPEGNKPVGFSYQQVVGAPTINNEALHAAKASGAAIENDILNKQKKNGI